MTIAIVALVRAKARPGPVDRLAILIDHHTGSLLEHGADSVLAVPVARAPDTFYLGSGPHVAWINRGAPTDHESMPWPRGRMPTD